MGSSKQMSRIAKFDVERIGGINNTQIQIPPGITILTGKNATNRTSFLQAIMAAMGSNQATLKGDAEEGHVDLEFDGGTYNRTLKRAGDTVEITGDGYLNEPEVADLFTFLLETNEARQAVSRSDDLREIIMRPVDVEAIKSEVNRIKNRKGEINDELATIESRKQDLSRLEQRRNSLREKIAETREELAAKEEEIDQSSRDIEESRREQSEFENKLDELRSTRSDLETVRHNIESQQESVESLKEERIDLEDKLDKLPKTPMGDHRQLTEQIDQLRNDRQKLNTEISELQSLIQYNEGRLNEEEFDLIRTLDEDTETDTNDAVTDQLLVDNEESVVCWTCGSTVDREQIKNTVDRLQNLRSQKVEELNEIKSKLEEHKTDQRQTKQKQNKREEVEHKLDEVKTEIGQREEQITSLKNKREELTNDVETLEDEVEALESDDFDEILTLHKEANQLEFEIDSLESDLEEVITEIEEIEAMIERADDLRKKREQLVEELTDKRTKIDQIEAAAVEQFNEHMNTILNILEYENLDRIWIERIEETVREGRENVDRTVFELHIVRTTENGAAYEDTIDHLSESEREVTGLIFALAGYLVHDLHETVPFMLLDSLEAIDADRIAALIEYFADYANYLVVALLPEDAQALDEECTRITSI